MYPSRRSEKQFTDLIRCIVDKNYSPDFILSSFTALGINLSNDMSIHNIMEVNYEARITKAQSWVNILSKRDLTLMGKVTI